MNSINKEQKTNVKRKRRRNARLRKKIKTSIMNDVVMDLEKKEIKALQPLHILSNHEYSLIKKNNIELQDMKIVSTHSAHSGNITIFHITEKNVGENIRKQFNILSQKNVINISLVKRQFITISMKISDLDSTDKTIKYVGTNPENSSGMFLLMIATYNQPFEKDQNVNDCVSLFKKFRYPIGSNGKKFYHHGTEGESYGVGLVAKYKKDENGFSFGMYSQKENINVQEQSISHELDKHIEGLIRTSLEKPLKLIPFLQKNIMIVGSSIKSHLKKLPENLVDELQLRELRSYMSAQFNINSVTHEAHTEPDQSSTLIFIPKQHPFYPKYYFEFILNHFTSIQLSLIPGTTIIYSSHLLVHRQISSTMRRLSVKKQHKKKTNIYVIQPNNSTANDDQKTKFSKNSFINISAYFNKRLYENIKMSLTRVQQDKDKKSIASVI